MLDLTVTQGDMVVRTDLNKTFINHTNQNESLADWIELSTPEIDISSKMDKTTVTSVGNLVKLKLDGNVED